MPSGHGVTRAQRECVWRMISRGCRNFRQIGEQVDLSWLVVREIVCEASVELMRRIDADRRSARIDELTHPKDS